jgi:hypothetical protein
MTLERDPPSSMLNTASESPPSAWPVQDTPRSNMVIPPSKEPPAAMVWAAERTEVPDEAGREPPLEPLDEPVVGEAVVPAEEALPVLLDAASLAAAEVALADLALVVDVASAPVSASSEASVAVAAAVAFVLVVFAFEVLLAFSVAVSLVSAARFTGAVKVAEDTAVVDTSSSHSLAKMAPVYLFEGAAETPREKAKMAS